MAPAPLVVLLGPAGCGKTTVGRLLARALSVPFADGDDFHPPRNRRRMAEGHPLDERDRAPWLAAIHARIAAAAGAGTGLVVACSALRHAHRERLAAGLAGLRFVHLQVDPGTLAERLARRPDHFFPPHLLASQLALFEPLQDGLVVDGTAPPEVTARLLAERFAAGT